MRKYGQLRTLNQDFFEYLMLSGSFLNPKIINPILKKKSVNRFKHKKLNKMEKKTEKEKPWDHIRITLTSKKIFSLEKICESIVKGCKGKKLIIKGPRRIPTKILTVSTRKSPCGEGTNTWDRFEVRIHKRILDLFSSGDTLRQVTSINIEPGVEVEVAIVTKKEKKR
mmetsp:Transcript_49016/g.98237  ORF Transcript_49016/g.98237 Transcript_49016/m.98237 type:complete len:168 (+) Transcript_49016:1060-1563(+)